MWGSGRVQNEEYPKKCGEVHDLDFMWVARLQVWLSSDTPSQVWFLGSV